jgi:excinuclease ABC subunit C
MASLRDALQLPTLPVRMECFDISNISTTHVVASMVCFLEGRAANHLYRRFRIRTVQGQDDFASMAEVVRRRYARVIRDAAASAVPLPREDAPDQQVDCSGEFSQESVAEAVRRVGEEDGGATMIPRLPDLVIVDGGKGQLGSACRELQRLGLHQLPVIGLAKEFEEIYRPHRPQPLVLPPDSGALRLLQRIRDEAHRFANTYHQLLMKRRIAESVLDDCPGVSQHRKELLLRAFGSVARLRKASAAQIAETAGIGPKLAEQIAQFLIERGG